MLSKISWKEKKERECYLRGEQKYSHQSISTSLFVSGNMVNEPTWEYQVSYDKSFKT